MIRKTSILLLLLLPMLVLKAQPKAESFSLALTNTHTSLPLLSFPDLFHKQFHPGFNAGINFNWKDRSKFQLIQTAKLGYFYHQYSQHGIMLYSELNYRRKFNNFYAEGGLGAGYLHSIPDIKNYTLNSKGEYEKKPNYGRPQFMPSALLGIGYYFNNSTGCHVFLNYQMWFQLPFVRSYVPVLPNSTIQLGLGFPLKSKSNEN